MKPQPRSAPASIDRRASIQVGNQTAFSAASLMAPFEYALERRFDAFEWFPDKKSDGAGWDERDLSPSLRADIRQAARARSMRLSVHARWMINPLSPGADLFLNGDLELAEDLGARTLVVHLYAEQGVAAYLKAILRPLRMAASKGIRLAVENTPKTTPEDFNLLFAGLRAANSQPPGGVGMCLDIGHANLCATTRNDYLAFIDQLDAQVPIIHLHAHENWGDADNHLPLFTGPSARDLAGVRGVVARLKRRGFTGSAILEQWPEPPSLLDQAREGLLRLWQEEEEKLKLESRKQKTGREHPAPSHP